MDREIKMSKVVIKGFKSIAPTGETIDFDDITIFLGANGAGKSNLISFFKMLNYMMTGGLQTFIGEQGFADSLLYYGSKITSRIQAELYFTGNDTTDIYRFVLSHAAGDTLIFTEESLQWLKQGFSVPKTVNLGAGHQESNLYPDAKSGGRTSGFVHDLLKKCRFFQFHDTSGTARIRKSSYINDNEFLRSDGGNLAPFLFTLKNRAEWRPYYDRIIRHIKIMMPQFDDFLLNPSPLNGEYIRLDWKEEGSDHRFGPHQISDGALRFMALTTLLLQPVELLPHVVIVDEPELGLHPSAISALAGMVKTASRHCQVILSTQSPRLVDEFSPHHIVIVERDQHTKSSTFKRLSKEALAEWLERYSLSELWEKNVLGGKP